MDILFQRSQKNSGKYFNLRAKVELDKEEQGLVRRYKFDQTVLVHVIQPGLMRRALTLAAILFFLIYSFFFFGLHYQMGIYIRISSLMNILLALGGSILISAIYYDNQRETIYVKDLIYGRHFKCRSVVALAQKEAYLQSICAYLRQVIESAKHWDGDEKFEVLPLPPEEAKRMILSGPVM